METLQEKLFFLKQLIEFAKVDGVLHDKELDFLSLLAEDFEIDKDVFFSLFKDSVKTEKVIVSFQDRIIQFYRLVLMMECDGEWHEKEKVKINEIGIMMGLTPTGISNLLVEIKMNGTANITPEYLVNLFLTQLN